MFRFEKLTVWQKAIDFADVVYDLTESFPGRERYGLADQMRRAAVSVSSNIAEGSGRDSDKDFVRFIGIAYASTLEVVSQSFIARRRGYVAEDGFRNVYDKAGEITRMLSGLRAHRRR